MPITRTDKIELPTTQQLTSYVNYDDGYYQKGSPISPRFIDNGDNTVTDRVSNLTWIQRPELIIPDGLNVSNTGVERGDWVSGTSYLAGDIVTDSADSTAWVCLIANSDTGASFAAERLANPTYWSASASIWATDNGGVSVNPVYMVWSNIEGTPSAINSCAGDGTLPYKGLIKSGKSDWRLPNLQELISIVNYGNSSPTIDPTFFPNTQPDNYWSATTYAGAVGYAWSVYFSSGNVDYYGKNGGGYARPVRSL